MMMLQRVTWTYLVIFFFPLPGEIPVTTSPPCMSLGTTIAPLCTAPLCTAHRTAPTPKPSTPQGAFTPLRASMSPTPLTPLQTPTTWRRSLNTSTAGSLLPDSSKPSKEPQFSCVSSSSPAWPPPWCGTWMVLGTGATVSGLEGVPQGRSLDIMEAATATVAPTWRHSLPRRPWFQWRPLTSCFHWGSWWRVSRGHGSCEDAASTSLCSFVISS